MVQPFQVCHEHPAEGARVAYHEQPGFRCPLQPVRLPASQHTFQRKCVSQHTKSAVTRCCTHESALHTRFPVLFVLSHFSLFLATSALTLKTGAALFLPVRSSAPILLFQ